MISALTKEVLEDIAKLVYKDPFEGTGILYMNCKAKEKLNRQIIKTINEMGYINNVSKTGIDEDICK